MGGIGSGRCSRGRKYSLDDCRRLDINHMVRTSAIPKQGWSSGSWEWCDRNTGEAVLSIGYESNTFCDDRYIQLRYTLTKTQEKFDYRIRLVKTKTRFGGERLWFICPVTYRRVGKLFFHPHRMMFLSRHACRLAYDSQSQSRSDRAINRMWKFKNKLGGYDFFPMRPKGIRERTYRRLLKQVNDLEDRVDTLFSQRFGAMMERWPMLD